MRYNLDLKKHEYYFKTVLLLKIRIDYTAGFWISKKTHTTDIHFEEKKNFPYRKSRCTTFPSSVNCRSRLDFRNAARASPSSPSSCKDQYGIPVKLPNRLSQKFNIVGPVSENLTTLHTEQNSHTKFSDF